MPRVRDLLDRFRPAGAPGKPSAAGVPADRRETLIAELEPVFRHLATTVYECGELRRACITSAARCEAEAAERARTIVSRAHVESAAERAHTAAAARERSRTAASQLLARAESAAAQVRRLGEQRQPELLVRVMERVRADVRALAPYPNHGDGT